MIFLDASAAAKRYCQEPGSEQVQRLFQEWAPVCSLAILSCELASVLNRKLRERTLTASQDRSARGQMIDDFAHMTLVPADDDLIATALQLLDAHPLKALDSLYLAGAVNLRRAADHILFVSADHQLLRAARKEGLRTLDPEQVQRRRSSAGDFLFDKL